MKIYHNKRCSKSRKALSILDSIMSNLEIIDYIKNPITFEELKEVIHKLKIPPIELIRKNEVLWKENHKKSSMTNDELIMLMINNPKLIQRPILVTNKKAMIGRLEEDIIKFINQEGI